MLFDMGIFERIIKYALSFLKLLIKVLWFIGIYWLFIFMLPSTLFTVIGNQIAAKNGTFMGVSPNSRGNVLPPAWVDDTGFYISLVFMGLTVIQNI